MKNNRYTQLKASSTIKNSLMESAMGWKQLNGCYPTVSEFSQKINELFGLEIFADDIASNTEEVNESHLSAFSSILGVLFEDLDHNVLGVPEGASLDEIKKAFRTKAKVMHPDMGGSPGEWKILSDAYARLIGPGRSGVNRNPSSSSPRPTPTPRPTPSSTPPKDTPGIMSKIGRGIKVVPKVLGRAIGAGVLASTGQNIAGEYAENMGAGPVLKTTAEIAGAAAGDKAASSVFNAFSKMRGKPAVSRASIGSAAGFVFGSKISDDLALGAASSLAGGIAGGYLEDKVRKALKSGKLMPVVGPAAVLASFALSDPAQAATPTEKEAQTQERGRGLASLTMPGLGLAMAGLQAAGLESPAARQAREEKELKRLLNVPSLSPEETRKGIHKHMSQWDSLINNRYMRESTDNYLNLIQLDEHVGKFLGKLAPEIPDLIGKAVKYAEPEVDTALRKIFFADLEKKMAEMSPKVDLAKTDVSKLVPAAEPAEVKTTEVKKVKPEEIKPIIPAPAKETAYEVKTTEIDTLAPKVADLTASKTDTAKDVMTDIKTELAPKIETQTQLQTSPQTALKTKTALETQTQTKTKQETTTKLALSLLTKTQTAPKLATETKILTKTQTQLATQPALKTNLQLAGAPKPITGVTPSVSTRIPVGYGGLKGAKAPAPEEPEKRKTGRMEPEIELPPISPMTDVRYPALRAASYGVLPIYEGIYNPKSSLQKKSEKQKYKIVVVQEGGKKVEIFASSLRGVKRAIYGKKNFRVYDAKGTEISSYFKRIQRKTQNKMKGK